MQVGNAHWVETHMQRIRDIVTDASPNRSIGLTIHGRYIEDYISDARKAQLREIALEYCGERLLTEVNKLADLGVEIKLSSGDKIVCVDDAIEALKEGFL